MGQRMQLPIAYAKCSLLLIGLGVRQTSAYYIDFVPIQRTDCVNDLGVFIDGCMNFNSHVNTVVARAFHRSNLILRCFISRNPCLLFRAFTTYVRPSLDYCSQVWSPSKITYIKKLESVQRRFTKKLNGLRHMSYPERLEHLNGTRLDARRLYNDLVMVYKIINGHVALDINDFFQIAPAASVTRGHHYKLMYTHTRVNARHDFFASRVIHCWNSLPAELVNSRTISNFKFGLNQIDLQPHLADL